jgi:hypothetical protein
MASILSKTLSQGKTVVFAGGTHEKDYTSTDGYGSTENGMLTHLRELNPSLGEPRIVIDGKKYDPTKDSDAVGAAEAQEAKKYGAD